MDSLSIFGIIIGLLAIIGGQYLEGGTITSLMNLPAFILVFAGTIGAVLLQTPLTTFKRALSQLPWILFPPNYSLDDGLNKILNWNDIVRQDGLLALEPMISSERDSFIKKSLQLLVDGSSQTTIKSVLEVELISKENSEITAARVFEGMGGYSPTIGILGAVIGLIHVMSNLSDPSELGQGIAIAFVATIYGVGFANLIYLPIANKIKSIIIQESLFREMLIDGIIAISEGRNPSNIRMKLTGFMR